jgi:uncharacterized oxidoreductase
MMSLPDYIEQTMQILQTQPTPSEICVENVKFLRFAEAKGNFDKALQLLSAVKPQRRANEDYNPQITQITQISI